MSLSSNKNFDLQVTGSNVNTWGVVNNSNFSIVDLNLGGRLNLSVAGSANVTATANQAQNLMHVLSGILTGNITYFLPALGGFYVVTNNTTGSFSLTVNVTGGGTGIVVPQGTSAVIAVNPDVPTVYGQVFGSSAYFTGGASTGGAGIFNVATYSPAGYTGANGNLVTFTAHQDSAAGANTLNFGLIGAQFIKKITASGGYTDLAAGDIKNTGQYLLIKNTSLNYYVLVNPSVGALAALGIGSNFQNTGGNLDFSTTPILPTGTTGTTQAVADNSTKMATTGYVDRANNNSQGLKTVSSSSPSGGNNGDIWYQV